MNTIRGATIQDAEAICAIYNPYVLETTITFEEQAVATEVMARRIADITSAMPWLVLEHDGIVAGYAYAGPWRTRPAYKYTAEASIYLAGSARRKGHGTALYRELIARLRGVGMHRVIGGAALPNPESVRLHEKLGFAKVAHFAEVGFKFGRWIDVGYWELAL